MSILFIVPYPTGKAASQRFRFEQYFQEMDARGMKYRVIPFLSEHVWQILYLPGRFPRKAAAILGGLLRRFQLLFKLKDVNVIFIHREATPIGPPFFEYIASRWLKKKIIYDFDDAIWIPNYSEANSHFSFLKGYANVKHICKWAWKISCGNSYLCDYARSYNPHTEIVFNPTTIDTDRLHNQIKNQNSETFIIGWTGSHSTVRYISELIPILKKLEMEFDFQFMVISDIPPEFELKSLVFRKWNKDTEISDLLAFNVGVMPLLDDKWANGKCGFKALQYMALGIPALVSPVGVNTQIVDNGMNGFVCNSADEWENSLRLLLSNRSELERISSNTRIKIEESYSVKSNTPNFLQLFKYS
jgi:glycosyltransferase involved in cell wall biosynthesis